MSTLLDSLPPQIQEATEKGIQAFFVLHKSSANSTRKSTGSKKNEKRKIYCPRQLFKSGEQFVAGNDKECQDRVFADMRLQAFNAVWSKIELTIKDVLREINVNLFNEILQWVRGSFNSIKSLGSLSFSEVPESFPVMVGATSKHIFTGMICTNNMELVDDLLTFNELGLHLKSHGCYVANLCSLDFSLKHGIGGCVRSILRQLLMVTMDVADISILATWYREQGNFNNPIVIILADVERCCGSVLSDFILMLREWILKIPVILIIGVATTLGAFRTLLPSDVLHHLYPSKFLLGTPSEKLDAIVEAVLVRQFYGFIIGHKVADFLRNYFVVHDGTITSFIRALKIACARHFSMDSPSVMLPWFLLDEEGTKELEMERYGLSLEMILKNGFRIPSCSGNQDNAQTQQTLIDGFLELKKLQNYWSIVVQCLYEAGKHDKIQLFGLLCDALHPESYQGGYGIQKDKHIDVSPSDSTHQNISNLRPGGCITRTIHKVKGLPASHLCKLLNSWKQHTVEIPEIHDKVKELLYFLEIEDDLSEKVDSNVLPKKHALKDNRNSFSQEQVHLRAAKLLEHMVRVYLIPIECLHFHEIVCFGSVNQLQQALIGDPRRRIQMDLLEFHQNIKCSCCNRMSNKVVSSMHDSSIVYALSSGYGDLINLHDWYHSFKSVLLCPFKEGSPKAMGGKPASTRKQKGTIEAAKPNEALMQARFCKAVAELQIAGLIRMASRRRPDFVQRAAFGL